MSTTVRPDTLNSSPPGTTGATASRRGWIDHWEPEDPTFWEATGKKIARRNLILSIFAENIGFSIWVLWTIIVLNLANAGITLTISQLFWLTAVPNLIGSFLRIPYTFAVPHFGGRLWTTVSASLLLIPVTLLAVIVPSGWLHDQTPHSQFLILLACAATAGLGGGNFSSSMANISFFYPEGKKGLALGLNAAGGNLGVAITQILVPLVIIIGVPAAAVKAPGVPHEVHLSYAGLVWMPFIVAAALLAWLRMDSLTQAKADTRSYKRALSHADTWIMSFLYIGTFGSFIGYSFALPLVIKNTFPEFLGHHQFIATYLAGLGFMGALIGSISRPFGGWVADKMGGARVTLACFVGMGLFTVLAIKGVNDHSFTTFFVAYMVIFFFAGAGNGSTYRMIPAIFAGLGRKEARRTGREAGALLVNYKRQAAAVIGIAGAIGAFGGFLIQVAFRQASLDIAALVKAAKTPAEKVAAAHAHQDWSLPALYVFLGAYVVMAAVTYARYMRKVPVAEVAPGMAHAAI